MSRGRAREPSRKREPLSDHELDDLANAIVELSWEVSRRTKAHAALMAALRALARTADFAEASRQLAVAERGLRHRRHLDSAYRALSRFAGRQARRDSGRLSLRFVALAHEISRSTS